MLSSPQLMRHNVDVLGVSSMLLLYIPYRLQMYKFHVFEHPQWDRKLSTSGAILNFFFHGID